ncbi:hypothetical protein STAFG_2165 [Streptomyces afghaniensis 772]|uniref:Uncharacterized protein n=1 Tax=Streptomyces afghaniensis 772 TaxID=1283301 RepID=S4MXX9_9ACTN|nr:hypothetical protein STAFG_2165 [Streptomyces afghaniensis 772]
MGNFSCHSPEGCGLSKGLSLLDGTFGAVNPVIHLA